MRKVIITFITLLLVLCSCSVNETPVKKIDKDRDYANTQLNMLLEAIENNDRDSVESLFSKNTVLNTPTLEKSIDDLFEYFKGSVEACNDWGGPFADTTKEDGEVIQIMESSFDVKTTECDYRFAIKYVTQDTADADNIGIHSLYIIKLSDDTYKEYAYWGDGKYTPGINIGIAQGY